MHNISDLFMKVAVFWDLNMGIEGELANHHRLADHKIATDQTRQHGNRVRACMVCDHLFLNLLVSSRDTDGKDRRRVNFSCTQQSSVQ
jgi:hypothetical protein